MSPEFSSIHQQSTWAIILSRIQCIRPGSNYRTTLYSFSATPTAVSGLHSALVSLDDLSPSSLVLRPGVFLRFVLADMIAMW